MAVRHVTAASLTLCYAERGHSRPDRSSLVFVHGLAASKDSWNNIVHVQYHTCSAVVILLAVAPFSPGGVAIRYLLPVSPLLEGTHKESPKDQPLRTRGNVR